MPSQIEVPEEIISQINFFDSFVDIFGSFVVKQKKVYNDKEYFIFEVENELLKNNVIYNPVYNDSYYLIGLKAPGLKEIKFQTY